MSKTEIAKRIESYDALNAKAREILKTELDKRGQGERHMTDFAHMIGRQQGYMATCLQDNGMIGEIIQVSFAYENTPDADGDLIVAWDPAKPIIVVQ